MAMYQDPGYPSGGGQGGQGQHNIPIQHYNPLYDYSPFPNTLVLTATPIVENYPAPVPHIPIYVPMKHGWKLPPPRPTVWIDRKYCEDIGGVRHLVFLDGYTHQCADLSHFDIFYYERANTHNGSTPWKSLGTIRPGPPFPVEFHLHNAPNQELIAVIVRSVDIHGRVSPFSWPECFTVTYNYKRRSTITRGN